MKPSRRPRPSSSPAASHSESSSDNSEDDDWSGSKSKKSFVLQFSDLILIQPVQKTGVLERVDEKVAKTWSNSDQHAVAPSVEKTTDLHRPSDRARK